jgi:hypothetical protein
LFKDAEMMVNNDELERMWKEVTGLILDIVPGRTEKNHKTLSKDS